MCHSLEFHPIGAMMAVLLIAFAKEVIWDDYLEKGTPEFLDIVSGLLGLATVAMIDNYQNIINYLNI